MNGMIIRGLRGRIPSQNSMCVTHLRGRRGSLRGVGGSRHGLEGGLAGAAWNHHNKVALHVLFQTSSNERVLKGYFSHTDVW